MRPSRIDANTNQVSLRVLNVLNQESDRAEIQLVEYGRRRVIRPCAAETVAVYLGADLSRTDSDWASTC
jgi:hypothetical protein